LFHFFFVFFFVFILFFFGEFVFVGKKFRSDESEANSRENARGEEDFLLLLEETEEEEKEEHKCEKQCDS
jgi:hypothetical protein